MNTMTGAFLRHVTDEAFVTSCQHGRCTKIKHVIPPAVVVDWFNCQTRGGVKRLAPVVEDISVTLYSC